MMDKIAQNVIMDFGLKMTNNVICFILVEEEEVTKEEIKALKKLENNLKMLNLLKRLQNYYDK